MSTSYAYKVICAWCKTLIEVKHSDDPHMEGMESHTCCEECVKQLMKGE